MQNKSIRKYTSNKISLADKTAVCKTCKQELDISKFRCTKDSRTGNLYYRRICRVCASVKYKKNNNFPKLRAQRLCACAIQRSKNSKKYKYDCDLTYQWIQEKIELGKCQVTNIPFILTSGHHPFAPSLDRIDSSKGYTKDNIQVVVLIYNTAKRQFLHDDVMVMAQALITNNDI